MCNNGRTVKITVKNRLFRNKEFKSEIRSLSKSINIINVLRSTWGNMVT